MKIMKKEEIIEKMVALYEIVQWIIDRFNQLGLPHANGYPSSSDLCSCVKRFLDLPIEKQKFAISELEKMQAIVDSHLEKNGLDIWIIQELERFASELKYLNKDKSWYNLDFDYGVRLRVSMNTAVKILHSFGFEIRR